MPSRATSRIPRLLEILERGTNSACLLASWWALRLGKFRVGGSRRAAPPQQHLLLFAWHFPPAINGGVYRPHSLAKHASKAGWQVTVVSGPPEQPESAAGMDLVKALPSAVNVFRTPWAPTLSYRLLPKSGDGCFPEIVTGSRAGLAACQENPPTAVLASGPPFHTFVSAYFVAKRFGVPLALEYRDEWSVHTPHFVEATAFDRKWERKLLRSASAVIFVTEATRDLYLNSVGSLDSGKCFVVPNGWDPDDFQQASVAPARRPILGNERFVISFVGTIGLHNDPSEFLTRFQEVTTRCPSFCERMLLRFVGPKITEQGRHALASFQQRFPNSIELVDGVAKAEAIAEMRRAGALLLFLDPFYDTSIPGKLYEYLAAGTPILVFGETGIAADLVRRLGAGIVVPANDFSALKAALELLSSAPPERWDTPERKAWTAKHTRGEMASSTLKVLSEPQASGFAAAASGQSKLTPAAPFLDRVPPF